MGGCVAVWQICVLDPPPPPRGEGVPHITKNTYTATAAWIPCLRSKTSVDRANKGWRGSDQMSNVRTIFLNTKLKPRGKKITKSTTTVGNEYPLTYLLYAIIYLCLSGVQPVGGHRNEKCHPHPNNIKMPLL